MAQLGEVFSSSSSIVDNIRVDDSDIDKSEEEGLVVRLVLQMDSGEQVMFNVVFDGDDSRIQQHSGVTDQGRQATAWKDCSTSEREDIGRGEQGDSERRPP
ncbi:hypothetical protein ON010_g14706 [Phytophthora cinnamomi]|nr:hypothetical protein ON010_g14706 [Phytophthora cinnamomi]